MQNRLELAYWISRITLGAAACIAGLDKFFNALVDWQGYLAPSFAAGIPGSPSAFMIGVGVVEVLVGCAILFGAVRLGAYVMAAWLMAIVVNLLVGGFYDIALRDVGLAAAAVTLALVAGLREREQLTALQNQAQVDLLTPADEGAEVRDRPLPTRSRRELEEAGRDRRRGI